MALWLNSPAMDPKTLHILEYPKILERLKAFCDFSASMELTRLLEPTDSHDLALARLAETSEARKLFSVQDIGVGADCGNGSLALYVDGQLIASVSDSSYTIGGVAVFTWNGLEATSTDMSFDDFLMTSLE
jgi:hypothetical protein